ncbi:uncharacterized protein LOC131072077 [Cryptomeria japonica]|uniref:uncharacterized protein LOC131072077 n=1 Tax=Cryptomeria japonica TaxID=3369 RepID=UPI0025ACD57E|nr:uncharacterized protein LOC131072077 [Cryptomeria japonica]
MKEDGSKRSSTFASCIVGALFLVFIIIILLILFFSLFKTKDPRITVNALQVPDFHVSDFPDPGNSTVNFTISVYLTLKNPNRASFNYYDSTLQLNYEGDQIGFMFIPAGKVLSQRSQFIGITLPVEPFSAHFNPDYDPTQGDNNTIFMSLEANLKMAGRVRVLHVFTHHVQASAHCEVHIRIHDGSLRSFHC